MLGVGAHGPSGPAEPRAAGPSPVGARPADSTADDDSRRTAPLSDAERDAWIVLNEVEGVGPATFARLIGTIGSASAVLDLARRPRGVAALVAATSREDAPGSLLPTTAAAIAAAAWAPDVILAPVRRSGLTVVVLAEDAYPSRLRLIALPPPVLYVRGSVDALDRERSVAVVGTRRPTEIGRATAARIADAVAGLGATVVSGLAFGIDAAAHGAGLAGGRPSVAVIGGGHARLYPAAHRGLAARIVDHGGAVISEHAPDTIPTRGTFPRRNRIISGLSDATVIVEAGVRSGSLTTAAWALEQGRGLYIVPGRLDDPAVAGSLAFLREAGPEARVVAGIPELLDDLGLLGGRPAHAAPTPGESASAALPAHARRIALRPEAVLGSLPPVERAIARALAAGHGSVDDLVAATGLGGATVLGALTALEMRGLVLEAFGRYRVAGALAGSGPSRRLTFRRKGAPTARPTADADPSESRRTAGGEHATRGGTGRGTTPA